MSTRMTGSWAAPWMADPFEDFGTFGELRRHMSRVLEELDRGAAGPQFDLTDNGEALELRAELPGFRKEDIEVQLERNTLTIRGRREVKAREGYVAHRRERGSMEFARAFALPCRVDAERTDATLEHGVLQLTLAKAPDEKPRRIEVRVS